MNIRILLLLQFVLFSAPYAHGLTANSQIIYTNQTGQKYGGTGSVFDIVQGIGKFAIGVRTMATGSQTGQEFYQLHSGILSEWLISPGWLLHSSIGPFQETGFNSYKGSYSLRGTCISGGLFRVTELYPEVEIAWGTIWAKFNGKGSYSSGEKITRGRIAKGVGLALKINLLI